MRKLFAVILSLAVILSFAACALGEQEMPGPVAPDQVSITVGETAQLTVTDPNLALEALAWRSEDENVALVDEYGLVSGVGVGQTQVALSVNEVDTAWIPVYVSAARVPVSGVTISRDKLTLNVGEGAPLSARVKPQNATDPSVAWSSDDESVAVVDSQGFVTAVGAGQTRVNAVTLDGGYADACKVTVTDQVPVDGVSLDVDALTLKVGEHYTLTAAVWPPEATDTRVRFSSSKKSVATVSASGKITAKAEGTATITVKTRDGGYTAACKVTVKEDPSVTLNKSRLTLELGDTYTVKATVRPASEAKKKLTWSSDNEMVATVNSSGKITARGDGVAVITAASYSGATAQLTVTVPEGGYIVLNHSRATLWPDEALTLRATVSSWAGSDSVRYASSNRAVATVSGSGRVTAHEAGTATITARLESGDKATCRVTVLEEPALNASSRTLLQGESFTLYPSESKGAESWSSSNRAVATVSGAGRVSARGVGSCTISVDLDGRELDCRVTVQPNYAINLSGEAAAGTLSVNRAAVAAGLTLTNEGGTLAVESDEPVRLEIGASDGGEIRFTVTDADDITRAFTAGAPYMPIERLRLEGEYASILLGAGYQGPRVYLAAGSSSGEISVKAGPDAQDEAVLTLSGEHGQINLVSGALYMTDDSSVDTLNLLGDQAYLTADAGAELSHAQYAPQAGISAIAAVTELAGETTALSEARAGSMVRALYPAQAYRVTAQGLNVRLGPGTGYDKCGLLKNGDTVYVLQLMDSWARIEWEGGTAYLSTKYIEKAE